MAEFTVYVASRAERDLSNLPKKETSQITADLEKLQAPRKDWPWSQIKRLHGHPYWEMKTGDFRSIFIVQGKKIALLRVVNRRDLERELKRIDWGWLSEWLKGM